MVVVVYRDNGGDGDDGGASESECDDSGVDGTEDIMTAFPVVNLMSMRWGEAGGLCGEDGSDGDVTEVAGAPISDKNSEVLYVLTSDNDITEELPFRKST